MAGRGLSEQNILDAILELESEEEDNLELELCNFDEDSWDSVADPEYQPETEELNDVEENLIHGIINAEEAEKEEREETPGSSKRKKQKLSEGRRNERSAAQQIRETEEVITIITPSTNNLIEKDGNFIWSKEPVAALGQKTPSKNIVHIRPGPTANAKNSLCPASCFKLFFTADILEEILVYTNKEINIHRENYNDKSHAVLSNLEMDELEAFLGLLVLSAALKDNHLATHMMFDTTYCGERYKATMPERRFKFILNCLRFDDKETRTARREMTKLAPVSSIWDKLLNNCRVNYEPGSYITIDEQLVGFRGKCPFRMYIPSKPNKYGIKIVMSCDSGTKYMLDAIVYLGKGSVPPAMAAGEYYVVELLKNVKGTNRNVTIDNWFTSVPLIQRLRHEYKITTVGTIKKNKPQLPIEATDIKFQKRAASTSLFIFHEDLTVVSYKPNNNKLVLLASSMHSAGSIHETTGKPEIVHVYNSTKGGVDSFDQMCQNINHGRKTRRWPLAFFQNMMNVAAINAYIVYTHNMCSRGQKPESRLNFMLSLHKELTEGFQRKRLATNTNMSLTLKKSIQNIVGASQEAHSAGEDQKGPRKYCNFCSYTKRRYTTTYCNCGLAICGEHAQKKCPDCA